MDWKQFKILLLFIIINFFQLIYCCIRVPEGSTVGKSLADNRFIISITGNPQFYEPGQKYNISLMGIQRGIVSSHTYLGFMLYAENDATNSKNVTDPRLAGTFEINDYHEIKFSDKCPNLLTHTNTLAKSKIQVTWTAPPPDSGCVSFKATVIEHRDVWYMDDGYLTKQLCEESLDDYDNQPPIMNPCCACDEAKYELAFEGKWSRHTHPKDFPANGWNTRFSDIIGASHTIDYRYWNYGELASQGLKEVAEHGSTRKLESELKEQSDQIRTIIKARGISYPNVTGKTFAVFRVDSNHHLISLVSMIYPSPDWIVGVSGLELCLPNCSWVEHKVHNLYPWDAGTDSGPSYMSADQPTIPADVIRRIKSNYPSDPRSPFYDPSGAPMKPLARLHITRRRLYAKKCDNVQNENEPIECSTTPWQPWSECNTKCGRGRKYRHRSFKNPELATRYRCQTTLREEKVCDGEYCSTFEQSGGSGIGVGAPAGGGGLDFGPGNEDAACQTTRWSPWSECSTKCGKGTKTRSRYYVNRKNAKKCSQIKGFILEENEDCEEFDCGGGIDSEGHEITDEQKPDECQIGDWSDWSPCSVSCGSGQKTRTRHIWNRNKPNQMELDPSDPCSALKNEETVECFDQDCNVIPEYCFYDPVFGPCRANVSSFYFYDRMSGECGIFIAGDCQENLNKFDTYEDCNTTCRYRIAQKRRNELTIENLQLGADRVDCKVSDWYLRPCNATCGEGYQIKTRKVLRTPQNGGKACPKKLVKVEKCYQRCPDEYYSESYLRRNGGGSDGGSSIRSNFDDNNNYNSNNNNRERDRSYGNNRGNENAGQIHFYHNQQSSPQQHHNQQQHNQQQHNYNHRYTGGGGGGSYGGYGGYDDTQSSTSVITDECSYGPWSPWTPCTATCGHSIKQQTRTTLNSEMNSRCRDRVRVEKCNVLPCSPRECRGPYC